MKSNIANDEHTPWHTERRWSIQKGGTQYECALLYHGTAEVQVYVSSAGRSLSAQRCESRDAAVANADALKAKYLREGGLLIA